MKKVCKATVLFMVVIFVSSMAYAGITQCVSVSSNGVQGNGYCNNPSMSADGRFVAYSSGASNLVPGDTNENWDIFVYNRLTGITQRVSVSSAGVQGNGSSDNPSISADGRFVAFHSNANNLISGDTNGTYDIFVHDRQTGITQRISVSDDGVQSNNYSWCPSISADGRFVAFWSNATNLISDDTIDKWDIFVHDRQTGITQRVSISSNGVQGNGDSGNGRPSISADGRFVAFYSLANNLVYGDTNEKGDVFVHDRLTGNTERVSISSDGVQADWDSGNPSMSADGRFVAFNSWAGNLVSFDTNGIPDIFVHHRQTGNTQRVSVSSAGVQGNGYCNNPSINTDGSYVAFESGANNLVPDDTNGRDDIFVYNRFTGITKRVSISTDGVQANDDSALPSISADGRFIAFRSYASNLVSGDTNETYDIFVYEIDFPMNVQGSVKLKDLGGLKTGIMGTAAITDGTYTDIHEIILDARGKYSFDTRLSGICSITIKCSHWLSKTISDVEIADGINIGEVTLTNGDIVNNNEVDFDDINAVRAAYGSIEGEPGWNPMADVNGSGEVDFDDINIVRSNYGEIGE